MLTMSFGISIIVCLTLIWSFSDDDQKKKYEIFSWIKYDLLDECNYKKNLVLRWRRGIV